MVASTNYTPEGTANSFGNLQPQERDETLWNILKK